MSTTRVGFVGGGPRGQAFLAQAIALTDRLEVVGITSRSPSTREAVSTRYHVPARDSIADLIAVRPDFVLVAVRREGAAEATVELVKAGIPVLVETPPAVFADDLRALWDEVGGTDLVQVAEQSMYMPSHVAKLSAVREGLIGEPTSVQVSSNHGYHAVAIMRAFLRPGSGPVTVRAAQFTAPVVNPIIRDVWQADLRPSPQTTVIATLDFGGSMGLYDFTDMQWFNPLRHRRIVVRGTTGEIDGDSVIRLADNAIVPSQFIRRFRGIDMNHEGFDLDGISLDGRQIYRNPYAGRRVSDEDIAASALLDGMSAWVHGSAPAPYPLADGCEDHLLALAIDDSVRTGTPITTATEPWASALTVTAS